MRKRGQADTPYTTTRQDNALNGCSNHLFECGSATERQKFALLPTNVLIGPRRNERLDWLLSRSATSLGPPGGRAPTRGISMHFPQTRSRALASSGMAGKALPTAAGVAMAAVASTLLNRWLAKTAEHRNPPIGRSITVEGVRLHYVERGTGTPLVLLHGNGGSAQKACGSVERSLNRNASVSRPRHLLRSPLTRSPATFRAEQANGARSSPKASYRRSRGLN